MLRLETIQDFSSFYEEHKDFVDEKFYEAAALCETGREFVLDVGLFQDLIDTGVYVPLKIFDGEVFAGYISVVVTPAILTQGKEDVVIDHIAIKEEYQGQGTAYEVLKLVEDAFSNEGQDEIMFSLPDSDKLEGFATKAGYKKSTVVYIKNIGETICQV